MEVASKTKTKLSEISNNNEINIDESFSSIVEKKTDGLVRDYKILSSEDKGGFFIVRLSVRVSEYKSPIQLKRLRIAVVPFRVGSSDMVGNEIVSKFSVAIITKLEDYLTQTRKFALIDRSYVEEQTKELNLISSNA